jgi:insertion element IS1 protein InsB
LRSSNATRGGTFLKKSCKIWIWKADCPDTGQLIDGECGHRDRATSDRRLDRLKFWKIRLSCTDDYQPYESAVPAGRHDIGKDQTYRIEQNNSRQRHWFARFKRRGVVVTRSLLMLELTMRLFATFHVNGNDAPLLGMALSMID